jgi:hypothetical protein
MDLPVLEDRGYKALMQLEAAYEKDIAATWKAALDDIRITMSKTYEKYAQDGILSKAEMTQYNRLSKLENELLETMGPAARDTIKQIDRLRPDEYQEAFFRYGWAVDNAAGIRLNWGALNKDAILKELANPFYEVASKRYTLDQLGRIRTTLSHGLAVGQSYENMMGDVKETINRSNYDALRILRTEGQYALSAGTDAAYARAREQGVEGDIVWDATLDGRTRPDHAAMDQQIRQPDGLFQGPGGERAPYPGWEGLTAGQRIHCRCRIRLQIAGYAPQLRRTRDEGIIPYMKYDDWNKKRKHWK